MVKAKAASTVNKWRNFWQSNPSLKQSEFGIESAIIQNESENTDVTAIASGTVSKYIRQFQAEIAPVQSNEAENLVGPFESFTVDPAYIFNTTASDVVADLLGLQSTLAALAQSSEKLHLDCKRYAESIETALRLANDNQLIASLLERNQRLEALSQNLQAGLSKANSQIEDERNYRIEKGNTHGEATGR